MSSSLQYKNGKSARGRQVCLCRRAPQSPERNGVGRWEGMKCDKHRVEVVAWMEKGVRARAHF
eukprot:6182703-Pleurochrysis_carterae.AAC.5